MGKDYTYMTAIVGILNKQAIAIAADSAVTINGGQKIYNSANKVFTLSKHHPVGIAIYNSAAFNSLIPWEVIIKMYRKELGDKSFPTIKDYANDFYRYLELFKNIHLSQDDINKALVRDLLVFWASEVCSFLPNSNQDIISSKDLPILSGTLKQIKEKCEQTPVISILSSVHKDVFLGAVSAAIFLIRKQIEAAGGNYNDYSDLIEDVLYLICTREYYSHPTHTGLAFFGYGDNEIYPTLYQTIVYNTFVDKLYWVEDEITCVDNYPKDAYICPMAQQDEILSYVTGVNPNMEDIFYQTTLETMKVAIDGIAKVIKQSNQLLAEAVSKIDLGPMMKQYISRIGDIQSKKIVTPLIRTVAAMGKEDMANLAENLIYLTSLKRHITPNHESVGGPVDVAVVSKGDGFVWIKRKHYFEPELNKPFFENYLNK